MIDSPGHLADRPATPADLLRSPQEFADPSALEEAALGLDADRDRKSTRLNSSHSQISYAVFCLKKKKKTLNTISSPTPAMLHPPTLYSHPHTNKHFYSKFTTHHPTHIEWIASISRMLSSRSTS